MLVAPRGSALASHWCLCESWAARTDGGAAMGHPRAPRNNRQSLRPPRHGQWVCDFKLDSAYADPAEAGRRRTRALIDFTTCPTAGVRRYPASMRGHGAVNRTSPDGKLTRRMEYEAGASQPNDKAYEWLMGDEVREQAEIYGQAWVRRRSRRSLRKVWATTSSMRTRGEYPGHGAPEGRFYGHTTRNKHFWVRRATRDHRRQVERGVDIRCRVREGTDVKFDE